MTMVMMIMMIVTTIVTGRSKAPFLALFIAVYSLYVVCNAAYDSVCLFSFFLVC